MNEIGIIDKVLEVLTKNENVSRRYSAEIDSLKERKRRFKENKYRLGVIGVTSSGKSTMINALLGEELLPVAAKPSSSQLVSCCKDKQRHAIVYFEDGKKIVFDKANLNPNTIKEFADEQFNPNNKKGVKQIEICSPKFEFPEDIVLVDSPGLDAYGYDNHEHLTMDSLLPTVDFCMFVTTCKTNSDDKMKQVLNQVAEYKKPVVVVQNMIDAIVPKEDGSKTKAQIAVEHKKRIERIITESSIKDKSTVFVVQISARYALNARKNKVKTEEDEQLLSQSNYSLLIDTIIKVFNRLKPRVEQNRLAYLKKEIDRIQKEAYQDGKNSQLPVGNFEFEGCIVKLFSSKDEFEKQLSTKLDKLEEKLKSIEYCSCIDQSYIDAIIKECNNAETFFLERTKSFRNEIVNLCERLNIPSRDVLVFSSFDRMQAPTIKTRTIPGYWRNKSQSVVGRLWSRTIGRLFDEHSGQEWVPSTEETDVEETRSRISRYVTNTQTRLSQSFDKWQKSVEKIIGQLQNEIDKKRAAYEARKNEALEDQEYLRISERLVAISSEITIKEENSSPTNPSNPDIKETVTERIPLSDIDIAYKIFKLSSIIKKSIHHKTISLATEINQDNVIIGWDADCESSFASRCFFEEIETDKIIPGTNAYQRVSIIHNPQSNKNELLKGNIFLLINAIQIGAAIMQIKESGIIERIGSKSKVFFVIQDAEEVIHGNALSEVLDELIDYSQKLPFKPIIIFNDETPIYSLAAIQAQTFGCMFHSDEVKIVGRLQESFPFLITSKNSNHVNIILNKLGKLYGKQ